MMPLCFIFPQNQLDQFSSLIKFFSSDVEIKVKVRIWWAIFYCLRWSLFNSMSYTYI